MKRITKLLILLVLTFIPVMVSAKGNITIDHKSYNKTTHVVHVDGEGAGKYVIVTLYDQSKQLAMYVADVKDGTYDANIKIVFTENKTITIKVGDINGTTYVKDTLEVEKSVLNVSKATVTGLKTQTYNGKIQYQKDMVVKVKGKTLVEGTDYTVSYDKRIYAGTVTITITGKGNYGGTKTVTFTRNKATNPLAVKVATKTVKYTKVKKAKQVVKPITVTKWAGTVTYKKLSGSAKLTVNTKTGKVTVKKGTKKGTYKVKVKIMASGNTNYKSIYGYRILTIKVK